MKDLFTSFIKDKPNNLDKAVNEALIIANFVDSRIAFSFTRLKQLVFLLNECKKLSIPIEQIEQSAI